jgi:hypothetical protein
MSTGKVTRGQDVAVVSGVVSSKIYIASGL